MSKNMRYTNTFVKGLTKLTGLSLRRVQEYARGNNPFNILEHPKVLEISDKQLEKIGLLNEFISSYNLLKQHESENKIKLDSSEKAGQYFQAILGGMNDRERLMIAFLDNGNKIIETKTMSEGTVGRAALFPREVLKAAIVCDCKAMILAHNHPGSSTSPSSEDKILTQRLVDIFHPLDISILDHIIVGGLSYTSMAEEGYIPKKSSGKANYEPFILDKQPDKKESCNTKYDHKPENDAEEMEL